MAGNRTGGLKAAQTNTDRYGADFYAKIGTRGGGVVGVKKGFALMKERDPEGFKLISVRGGSATRQKRGQ